jgi:transcriptional regulator with PAS, ATPase and Fis domain
MVATRKSQIDHIVNFNQRRMPKDERRSNAQQAIKETKRQYLHRAGDTGFIKKKAAATLKISVRTLNRWLEE